MKITSSTSSCYDDDDDDLDDVIFTSDDYDEMRQIKGKLAAKFEMKDLGNLGYFLGMEVETNRTGFQYLRGNM